MKKNNPQEAEIRHKCFSTLFPKAPDYQWKQIQEGLFSATNNSWQDLTSLAKTVRTKLEETIPWTSYTTTKLLSNNAKDTFKALLQLRDGLQIETVLMANSRNQWTICVSSQVGCAMGCRFCATGTMGLLRNLSEDEIIDQYRFWLYFLANKPTLPQRISNIVMMGMGEPLANYETVKKALHIWLENTDIGPTHITVSTVGVLPFLDQLLNDSEWPNVRLAISLHSANTVIRKNIIPTSHPDFLNRLASWTNKYLQKNQSRRQHLTFEYTLLKGVNDSQENAVELAKWARKLGKIKINLIPWNYVNAAGFEGTDRENADRFLKTIKDHDIPVTMRKTMGDDIAAACGQLATTAKE
ncbi:MAG: 23S rRNA (adenine(2503)-C(2))-methyltransferase RlmN [bacterium]